MPDIITFGETMAVFAPNEKLPLRYCSDFKLRIAGAESNTAIGLSKLGHSTGFVTALGDDELGLYVINSVRNPVIVTDPPYNVAYEGTAGTIQNDNMDDKAFYNFLLAAYKNMVNVMADDASIYVFHADTEGLNFRKAFVDAGLYFSGVCIWAKQSLVLGRSPYQWKHEPILFGWKKSGKHKWFADRKQSTIWNFDRPKKSELHPTMKPIAWVAYPILNSSMTNGLVLDPFGGSGSTLIACEQTGRTCYTIELAEKYADVIVKRYIDQVGNSENVYVIRNGEKFSYADLQKYN